MLCFSRSPRGLYSPKKNSNKVKNSIKMGILALAILAFGAVRMPFEAGLSSELRTAGLTSKPLEIATRDRIDQTSSAVVLGGLRTLVATFLNLRAFSFFQEKRWDEVAETYRTIVDLAPRTRYYWETGAWHSAYNAASSYFNDTKLAPLRRREAWRASIIRGRAFLERGIRNNPNDWNLLSYLGFMLSDVNKFPAFPDSNETFAAAADAYRRAVETGNALPFVIRAQFYSLARVQGKETEALAMARSLYNKRGNQTPTIKALLFVLEAHENPEQDLEKRAIEIFETPEKAYEALSGHWMRVRERYPIHGVAATLESLEKTLQIDPEKSILKKPIQQLTGPDDWFVK